MAVGSGAIRAGQAFIEILLKDDAAVGRGLRKVMASLWAFGKSVNSISGSVFGALGSIGSASLSAITSGAKIAGLAVAALGAGTIALAKSFADGDRGLMSPEQAAAADRMKQMFSDLSDTALAFANTLMTYLQPGIEAFVDIVRVALNAGRQWLDDNKNLIKGVTDTMKGIRDAVSAGGLSDAFQLAWSDAKLHTAQGIKKMLDTVRDSGMIQGIVNGFYKIMDVVSELWTKARKGAVDFGAFVEMAIIEAGNRVQKMLIDKKFWVSADEKQRQKEGLDLAAGFYKVFAVDPEAEKLKAKADAEGETDKSRLDAERKGMIEVAKGAANAFSQNLEQSIATLQAERDALLEKSRELMTEIPTGLEDFKKTVEAAVATGPGTVAGTFAGSRSLSQLASDLPSKALDVAKETAKYTKKAAESLAIIAGDGFNPGLAVT